MERGKEGEEREEKGREWEGRGKLRPVFLKLLDPPLRGTVQRKCRSIRADSAERR